MDTNLKLSQKMYLNTNSECIPKVIAPALMGNLVFSWKLTSHKSDDHIFVRFLCGTCNKILTISFLDGFANIMYFQME